MIRAKVRKVGTSLGVLIPKELVKQQKIKEGEEIDMSFIKKRKLNEVLKLIGTAKGTKPFERDRTDRVDRW